MDNPAKELRDALYLILTASDMSNGNASPHIFIPKISSIMGMKCGNKDCAHNICAAIRNAERVFEESREHIK